MLLTFPMMTREHIVLAHEHGLLHQSIDEQTLETRHRDFENTPRYFSLYLVKAKREKQDTDIVALATERQKTYGTMRPHLESMRAIPTLQDPVSCASLPNVQFQSFRHRHSSALFLSCAFPGLLSGCDGSGASRPCSTSNRFEDLHPLPPIWSQLGANITTTTTNNHMPSTTKKLCR